MARFSILRRLARRSSPSSTASHLEPDYDELSSGVAAEEFYGVPLSPEGIFGGADAETLVYLVILLLLVLLKPAIKPLRDNAALSLAFWTAVLAAAYAIKEVTLHPLVRAIILTRTSYPYLVVLPHCIAAAASYRKEKTRGGRHVHYTCSLGMAFFTHGFGGSIVSDVLMGLPATALGHFRIVPCWLVGWTLVWYSPFDVVYKLLNDRGSFFFYFMNACEGVDGVTTPMGRVSRSARELTNKGAAPVVAGVLAGCGGAAIRYGERALVWGEVEAAARVSRDAIEAAAWKNFWYSLTWWYLAVHRCRVGDYEGDEFEAHHCKEFGGNDWHRFAMVMAHVTWYFGCDLGLLRGSPITFLSRHLRNGGYALANALRCGPSADAADDDEGKKFV